MDIFIISFILLLGVCFVAWGIYQMRTGKMVASKAKHAIDEPREAGLAFIILGLNLLFYLAPFVYGNTVTPLVPSGEFATNLAIISAPLLAVANTALFAFIALIGFRKSRIFAVSNDKSTKNLIKKFAKPIAILAAIRACLFPAQKILQVLSILSFPPLQLASAVIIVILDFFGRPLLLIAICILYLLLYRETRWPRKSTKAKSKKPTKVAKSRKK